MSRHAGVRSRASIDLAALERNLGRIRAALPAHIRYVSVVKADAYGHGLRPLVTRLMQSAADAFAVANVQEGSEIREVGRGWPILVLSPVLAEECDAVFDYELTPTISSTEEVERFEQAASRRGRPLNVHLKIDTGMARVGVWHEDADGVLAALDTAEHLRLSGVYTHYSSADTDPDFTSEQRELFLQTLQRLKLDQREGLMVHADNSAALEHFSAGPFNAVRIGLLQFGLLPHPGSLLASLRTEPVLRFETRIGLIKSLPAGTGLSYNRTHRLARASRIAVLTAGYGDGLPTSLSNRAQVLIHGQRCPVLGRVTMDQCLVDVTDLPAAQVGDTVTLIGKQGEDSIDVREFARWANSIPWEIFCAITKRVQRVYHADRSQ